MKEQITIDGELWKDFAAVAKAQRQNPLRLLADYMRESLEIWEHQKLDREIQNDVRKSGYTEDDAVEIVRKYRMEKKNNRAAS